MADKERKARWRKASSIRREVRFKSEKDEVGFARSVSANKGVEELKWRDKNLERTRRANGSTAG